ncbi:MAG TPA: hypothetical protein DCL29_08715 [Eubacterium sp.]|nr:hypothetical protein [Eubacterium sp.]
MQATMNFVNKADLLWNLHNGCDHSYMVYHIVNYLSSAEYENLSRAFYKTLTLQKYGSISHRTAA